MRLVYPFALLLPALAWTACARFDQLAPPVTPAMVAASTGGTARLLGRGREVYAGACTACHAAEPIGKYTSVRWREIVGDMAERSELANSDRSALLAYLWAVKSIAP